MTGVVLGINMILSNQWEMLRITGTSQTLPVFGRLSWDDNECREKVRVDAFKEQNKEK